MTYQTLLRSFTLLLQLWHSPLRRIRRDATGVVYYGTLKPNGIAIPLDVVIKLTFNSEQRDALRSEYEVNRCLRSKGVHGCITTSVHRYRNQIVNLQICFVNIGVYSSYSVDVTYIYRTSLLVAQKLLLSRHVPATTNTKVCLLTSTVFGQLCSSALGCAMQ
jgi:hypothetical protein